MIAGLETPTDGEIWIGDRCVNDIAPRDRDVAMVFQSARSIRTSPCRRTSSSR